MGLLHTAAANHDLPQVLTDAWFRQLLIVSVIVTDVIVTSEILEAFQKVHKHEGPERRGWC